MLTISPVAVQVIYQRVLILEQKLHFMFVHFLCLVEILDKSSTEWVVRGRFETLGTSLSETILVKV